MMKSTLHLFLLPLAMLLDAACLPLNRCLPPLPLLTEISTFSSILESNSKSQKEPNPSPLPLSHQFLPLESNFKSGRGRFRLKEDKEEFDCPHHEGDECDLVWSRGLGRSHLKKEEFACDFFSHRLRVGLEAKADSFIGRMRMKGPLCSFEREEAPFGAGQFFRIHIGLQSPEGYSTSHGTLRRFSDFLKLFSALKRAFPRKDIPAAPPKHAFLRINSSRMLLEERRHALEVWIGRVLSDIDLSRSPPIAAFLDLEAAARTAFQDSNQHLETSPSSSACVMASSLSVRPSSGASDAARSAVASKSQSTTSDGGSENAYDISDLGTPRQEIAYISKTVMETLSSGDDLTSPVGAIYGGVPLEEPALDQPEECSWVKLHHKKENFTLDRDIYPGSSVKELFLSGDIIGSSEQNHEKLYGHARKLSSESIASDMSSARGSEISLPGVANSIWNGSVDLPVVADSPNTMDEMQFLNDSQIVLPLDQRHKLNRVLLTMQRRLVTAKTDMEDLIARLNQEMTVKEYLSTKVKDLEVELEVTKQKSKENLQQTILIERERVTQMQWDMDEFRRKYIEMESKLKLEQREKARAESEKTTASSEKESLLQELLIKGDQIENLQKRLEDLETKSIADKKVLVKEVKFLRNSQAELKEMLNHSMKEKTELEKTLQNEKQRWGHAKLARMKLVRECEILRRRLQECSVNVLAEGEDQFVVNSPLSDALGLLTTSDNRIGLLLAEAQLLAQDDEEHATVSVDKTGSSKSSINLVTVNGDDPVRTDDELRKMLTDTFIDNARLRKQINSVIRCALNTMTKPEDTNDEAPSRKTVLNRFLER